MTRPRSAPSARRELGRELRRLRADELHLTQPRMAEWLGVGTVDDRGRTTSTGKSLVSRFESGARVPDAGVVDQYAKVPGVDAVRLRALWSAAVGETEPAPETDPGDPPTPAQRRRLRNVLLPLAAVVVVGLGVSLWWGLRDSGRRADADDLLATPVPGVSLVFDALGEQSDQTIHVYTGYGRSSADKTIAANYQHGQTAAVICSVRGRNVTSDPTAGERPVSSDVWFRIIDGKGQISYATKTYARISPTTATVPPCEAQSSG